MQKLRRKPVHETDTTEPACRLWGLAVILAFLLPTCRPAQALEFTPLLGLRGGGEFVDTVENRKHLTSSSETLGLIVGSRPYDQGKRLELYFSRQSTEIRSITLGIEPEPYDAVDVPLNISYLHLGGTVPLGDDDRVQGFVSGGLGLTYMEPDFTGLKSETFASMSIGTGLRLPMTEHLGLRLEARLLASLVDSDSAILCSGGCAIRISGSAYYQAEAFAGISFDF